MSWLPLPDEVVQPGRTYTVDFADAIFKEATTAVSKTLLTLDVEGKLRRLCVRSRTPFVGVGINAISCSLGSATPGNEALYLGPLDVMQTERTRTTGGLYSGRDVVLPDVPDGNLDVVLYFIATGAAFGNGVATVLTAGKIWVTVYSLKLPAGT